MQKTVKKPVAQTAKTQVTAKTHTRKLTSDLTKKLEEVDEPLQEEHVSVNRADWTVADEQKMDLIPKDRKETFISAVRSQEPSRKSSLIKLSPGTNESNTKRRLRSELAKKSELRERFFGSSGSDNNVSRSGSSNSTPAVNTNSVGETIPPFSGGHNTGAMNPGKKGPTQMVNFSPSVYSFPFVYNLSLYLKEFTLLCT